MTMRLVLSCAALTTGFGLTTFALAEWQAMAFSLHGLWPFADEPRLHPVHVLAIGITLIPPSLWEIFLLDHHRHDPHV